MMKTPDENYLQVARIGKLVGIKGDLKLHDLSDFPQQFVQGRTFLSDKGEQLQIVAFNPSRKLVRFEGFESRESASCLVNQFLYSTLQETQDNCQLEEDEFYWHQVIGLKVEQSGSSLGLVKDIERIGSVDYLRVATDAELIKKKLPKEFYIPYIDAYVIETDIHSRCILVKDALALLENS